MAATSLSKQTVTPAITALRVKDLQQRASRLTSPLVDRALARTKTPEPERVKAARKLVAAFDKKSRQVRKTVADKARQRVQDAQTLVLYGDMAKALATIEALEKEAGRGR